MTIDDELALYEAKPWAKRATAMFEEWRTQSPNICKLCWLRFMKESERAIDALQNRGWPKSFVMRLPYLSNGNPVKHYKRRVTLADFGVSQ